MHASTVHCLVLVSCRTNTFWSANTLKNRIISKVGHLASAFSTDKDTSSETHGFSHPISLRIFLPHHRSIPKILIPWYRTESYVAYLSPQGWNRLRTTTFSGQATNVKYQGRKMCTCKLSFFDRTGHYGSVCIRSPGQESESRSCYNVKSHTYGLLSISI